MNLLNPTILAKIANEMNNLEDTFAIHTITLVKTTIISDRFDNNANYGAGIVLKCLVAPRTQVDESDSVFVDDLGVMPKQQITFEIFKREAVAKGIYNANTNTLSIELTDNIIYEGNTYYINQVSPIGFFERGGELIKIRATAKVT
jgi:hypothetical protein